MSQILSESWFWIIVFALIVGLMGPLLIIWLILVLPAELKLATTILVVIGWGIVSGYKDWVKDKRRQKEETSKRE